MSSIGNPLPSDWREQISSLGAALTLLGREADGPIHRQLLFILLLGLASAGVAAFTPVALKFAVEWLGDGAPPGLATVALAICAYAAGLWLSRGLAEWRGFILGRAEQTLVRRLSRRLFAHILALPPVFHLGRKTGAIGQILQNGMLGFRLLLQQALLTALPVLAELLMIGAVLIWFGHGGFLLVIGASAIAYALAFAIAMRRISVPAAAVSAAAAEAGAVMTDSLLNYEAIKAFAREPWAEKRYDGALARTEHFWGRFFRSRAANGFIVASITAVSFAASLLLAAHGVASGDMTVGDFVLVNAYVLQIVRPLEMLGFALRDIAQAIAFLEKLVDLLREVPEARPSTDRASLPSGPAAIVFSEVGISYRQGPPALDGVSFGIAAGTTVALVGASGAGKSTVARLLLRFIEPQKGRLLLDCEPLAEIVPADLRRMIAIIPQDTLLLDDTIASNIALARPGASRAQIARAAKLAHLDRFIEALPSGYDTIVGERGLTLSGGERQRIAFARAALSRSRVLLLDEATSQLDSVTERSLLETLPEISRGATTLIIAHRLSAAVTADDILVLDHGRLVERGRHCDLLAGNGHYAALWKAQCSREDPGAGYGEVRGQDGVVSRLPT